MPNERDPINVNFHLFVVLISSVCISRHTAAYYVDLLHPHVRLMGGGHGSSYGNGRREHQFHSGPSRRSSMVSTSTVITQRSPSSPATRPWRRTRQAPLPPSRRNSTSDRSSCWPGGTGWLSSPPRPPLHHHQTHTGAPRAHSPHCEQVAWRRRRRRRGEASLEW